MFSQRRPAFLPGSGLPSSGTHRLQFSRPHICRASASVSTAPSTVGVSVDNGREGGSVITLSGDDKPFLLRDLNAAVAEAGFEPKRINLLELSEDTPATAEYLLDTTISDADVSALRARVEAVWAGAAPHPPAASGEEEEERLVAYNVPDKHPLPVEAVEAGMWFDVDPYAHRDWTTLTCIVPSGVGSHEKMMKCMAEQKLNIIFATVRSVAPCEAGYTTDVYLLQTMAGEPMAESERVNLHNAFVDVLVQ